MKRRTSEIFLLRAATAVAVSALLFVIGCGGGGGGASTGGGATTSNLFLTVSSPSVTGQIFTSSSITVSGYTTPGASVTINDAAATVAPDGAFSLSGIALSTTLSTQIIVRAATGSDSYTINRLVYYQNTSLCTIVYSKQDPRTGRLRIFNYNPSIPNSERMIGTETTGASDSDPALGTNSQSIVFVRTTGATQSLIKTSCATGSAETVLHTGANYMTPSWAHAGNSIAFSSNADGNMEIYTIPATGGATTRITNHASPDTSPTWTSDDSAIVFASYRATDGTASTGTISNIWKIVLSPLGIPALLFDPTAPTAPACSSGQGTCSSYSPDINANNLLIFQFDTPATGIGGTNPPGGVYSNIRYLNIATPTTIGTVTTGNNSYTRPKWNTASTSAIFLDIAASPAAAKSFSFSGGVPTGSVSAALATDIATPDW